MTNTKPAYLTAERIGEPMEGGYLWNSDLLDAIATPLSEALPEVADKLDAAIQQLKDTEAESVTPWGIPRLWAEKDTVARALTMAGVTNLHSVYGDGDGGDAIWTMPGDNGNINSDDIDIVGGVLPVQDESDVPDARVFLWTTANGVFGLELDAIDVYVLDNYDDWEQVLSMSRTDIHCTGDCDYHGSVDTSWPEHDWTANGQEAPEPETWECPICGSELDATISVSW